MSPATGTPTAGTLFNVTITAFDQLGDRFSGFTGSQALTWSGTATASSPNGTAPTLPTSATFTNGMATVSVTLTKAQNGAVLTVAQGTPSGSTTAFTINGAATAKSFTLSTPSPTAGNAFSETVPPSTPTATRRRATPAPRL